MTNNDANNQQQIIDDGCPWFAVRLFSTKLMDVSNALQKRGLQTFIPMQYVDYEDREGKHRTKLSPVVRNLLFVRKSLEQQELRSMVKDFPFKISVLHKIDTSEFYEIPSKQMYEFQVMCNPDLLIGKYMSEEEAKLKKGSPVLVTHGPLKGLTGKLVRQSHKYYLLKEVPGMAVMIKVTRWCCKALVE
jgi:transcription antitermination factor NusG